MLQLENYLSDRFQKSHTGYPFFNPTKGCNEINTL